MAHELAGEDALRLPHGSTPGTTEGPGTANSAPPASVAGSRGHSPKPIQAGAAAPLQV